MCDTIATFRSNTFDALRWHSRTFNWIASAAVSTTCVKKSSLANPYIIRFYVLLSLLTRQSCCAQKNDHIELQNVGISSVKNVVFLHIPARFFLGVLREIRKMTPLNCIDSVEFPISRVIARYYHHVYYVPQKIV